MSTVAASIRRPVTDRSRMHAEQPRHRATWTALAQRHFRFDLRATRELHRRFTAAIDAQTWTRLHGSQRRLPIAAELRHALSSLLWIELVSPEASDRDGTLGMSRSAWIRWDMVIALDRDEERLAAWARDRLARLHTWLARHGGADRAMHAGATEDPDLAEAAVDDALADAQTWYGRPTVGQFTIGRAAVRPGGLPSQRSSVWPAQPRDEAALSALLDVLVLFNARGDARRLTLIDQLRAASDTDLGTRALTAAREAVSGDPELRAEHHDLGRALSELVALVASGAPEAEWPAVLQPESASPRVAAWLVWHALDLGVDSRRGMRRVAADLLTRWGFSKNIYNGITAYLQQINPLAEAAIHPPGGNR